MARRTQFIIFLSVFMSFVFADNSEICIQESPCSCKYEDGRKIDLKNLAEKDFLTVAVNTNINYNLTYYFHACSDKKPTFPGNIKYLNSTCEKTSLCLLNQTGVNATATNFGKAEDVTFTFAINSEKYLVYNEKKSNMTTLIHLACTPEYLDSDLIFKQSDSKTAHNLVLFSKEICPIYEKSGLSTGSVLVIVLLTFSALYLLGGAAVLHFLRGARGIEMIPNFEFWTDLPCLVKDGAVFLQNGCKPTISNSDSYDRI